MKKTTRICLGSLAVVATVCASGLARAEVTIEAEDWLKVKLSGDLRLRDEVDVERTKPDDRPRHRIRVRARLGTGALLFDQVDLGFRIATGSRTDENSTHQTGTDGFSRLEISIDRAYAKWTLEKLGGSYVIGGKFSHPFYRRPGYSEMVWDGDVHPAGAAIAAKVPIETFLDQFNLVGGVYVFQENSLDDDGFLYVGQTSFDFRLVENLVLSIGSGFYYLPNTEPGGSTTMIGRNQGNAVDVGADVDGDGDPAGDGDDVFVEDFTVVDSLLGLKFTGNPVGFELGGQVAVNAAADADNVGFGFGAGVPIGLGGDHKLTPYVDYQQVEREAVFSPWAQDDHQRTVNYRGIVGGLKYSPKKFFRIHTWVLTTKDLEDDVLPWATRVRLDLDFKF